MAFDDDIPIFLAEELQNGCVELPDGKMAVPCAACQELDNLRAIYGDDLTFHGDSKSLLGSEVGI
jgi:hypothetical protein